MKAFARPEDVSADNAYSTDPWTVLATDTTLTFLPSALRGRCVVVLDDKLLTGAMEVTGQQADVFLCAGSLVNGDVKPAPKALTVKGGAAQPEVAVAADAEARGVDDVSLKTLDIFAGALTASLASLASLLSR